MGFELEPVRVGRRRRPWSALAVALGATAIVAVALAGSLDPAPAPSPAPPEAAVPEPSPRDAAPPPAPSGSPRPTPRVIECHDVTVPDCLAAVRAAIALLDPALPRVGRASVHHGITCGDSLDCPSRRLRDMTRPIATVHLSFVDDGPDAWVNVIAQRRNRPLDAPPRIAAWLVRWVGTGVS